MLSNKLNHRLDKPLSPLVRWLAAFGVSPNMLTLAGLVMSVAAGVVLSLGSLLLGGIFILLGGLFDLLDGALARVTGNQTTFGGVLDSTIDRYSDTVPIIGLLLYYSGWRHLADIRIDILTLCGIVIVGSLLVSYVRARAEVIGQRCGVGIAERAERVLILAGGLIFDVPAVALWILAVLTHLTVLQRVLHVRAQLREDAGMIHSAQPDKLATPDAKIEP